jgi:hypothetical protein
VLVDGVGVVAGDEPKEILNRGLAERLSPDRHQHNDDIRIDGESNLKIGIFVATCHLDSI